MEENNNQSPIDDKPTTTPPHSLAASRAYIRYAGMATQMGLLIGGFAYLGVSLDKYFVTKPIFTLIGSLFGVGLSLYMFIKQAFNDK